MNIEIRRYTKDDIDSVKAFNKRLSDCVVSHKFPESETSSWLPDIDGRRIFQEYFLTFDDDIVRGGYILKHQDFYINGKIVPIADYQLPLSEGIIDKKYRLVGVLVLMNALKRQKKLFGLGMGSYDAPIAKTLKAAHWKMYEVPFYFKVVRPFTFLREITFLRKHPVKRFILDLLAFSGVGWLFTKFYQFILKDKNFNKNSVLSEIVEGFSGWADDLWDRCKGSYFFIAVRDSEALNILYPEKSKRFTYIKVKQNDEAIGWAVVTHRKMTNHKQFGNMHVGTIVDCLALPKHAFKVTKIAADYLEKQNVDIIVSNQCHFTWCLAAKKAGFIKGHSNFIFTSSVELSELLEPYETNLPNSFLNRGDGDGPIHL